MCAELYYYNYYLYHDDDDFTSNSSIPTHHTSSIIEHSSSMQKPGESARTARQRVFPSSEQIPDVTRRKWPSPNDARQLYETQRRR